MSKYPGKPSKDVGTNTEMVKPASLESMRTCSLSKEEAIACLQKAKIGGMILGCIIGCFLETGMLGGCWVWNSMNYTSDPTHQAKDSQAYIIGILLWCLVTGGAAVTICFMLRNLVWAVFVSTYDYESANADSRRLAERLMHLIVKNVDAWFGGGCVLGMSSFWALTYCVLGLQDHLLQSFWVGLVASATWFFISWGAMAGDSLEDILAAYPVEEDIEASSISPPTKPDNKPAKRTAVDPPAIEMAVPLLGQGQL
jgi:hypothetical protein